MHKADVASGCTGLPTSAHSYAWLWQDSVQSVRENSSLQIEMS